MHHGTHLQRRLELLKEKGSVALFVVLGALIVSAVALTSTGSINRADADDVSTSVTVGNSAPTLTVSLNGGNNITLTEGSYTMATTTITVTDSNGCSDIDIVRARLYHAATNSAGTSCTADDNNCYNEFISCTATTTGNTCDGGGDSSVQYDCSFKIWYIADPTDAGAPSGGDVWLVAATSSDGTASTTATNTGQAVEVSSLLAISVTASIAYGSVGVGSDTGATNQPATSTNTGNRAIDNELSGDVMCTNYPTCDGASTTKLQPSVQKYGTSGFTYSSGGTNLTATTSPVSVELDLAKPTATTTAVEDPTFWGISIPAGMTASSYTGENVFTAVAD